MKIRVRDGLPFVNVILKHQEKVLEIEEVLLDTGSASTIFSYTLLEPANGFNTLQTSEQLFERGTQKRQATYISVSADRKQFVDKKAFLLDLRDSEAFRRYRIQSSLNIPSYTLKNKTFFKPKSIILVKEGHSYHALEKIYATLIENGFQTVFF